MPGSIGHFVGSMTSRSANARDLIALDDARTEVIHGVIITRRSHQPSNGDAQLGLGSFLRQHGFTESPGRAGSSTSSVNPCDQSDAEASRVCASRLIRNALCS
jgi:hypothetical protein